MTVYNIPVEPSGPLWDSDGIKWIKREGATIWITAGDWFDQRSWGSLLSKSTVKPLAFRQGEETQPQTH